MKLSYARILNVLVVVGSGSGVVATASNPSQWWQKTYDPVVNVSDWSTKDATMGFDTSSSKYILAFSAFYDDIDPNTGKVETISHVLGVLTNDFIGPYGSAVLNISGHDQKWKGMCSPNFYEAPQGAPIPSGAGKYIITMNSWGDIDGRPNQLFISTSSDLRIWSTYAPLGSSRTAGDRAIDAAVAWIPMPAPASVSVSRAGTASEAYNDINNATGLVNQWVLAYKDGAGKTRFGVSDSLDGNFSDPLHGSLPQFQYRGGKASSATHENFQFFHGPDAKLRIVTSDYGSGTVGRETWVYTQAQDGDLSNWVDGFAVPVDKQSFNRDDNSNAGYVADWRSLGDASGDESGQYYMLWAGNNNHDSFSGRGHNELGITRSPDLVHWETLKQQNGV